MNIRITPKERGLLKGAIRRVFSRSETRRSVLAKAMVSGYHDTSRPRVTKWCKCTSCNKMEPTYLCQVDHIEPIVPTNSSLEEMTWDQIVNNTFCIEDNLAVVCKPCHRLKTLAENKERRAYKKGKNEKK